jgi:hypothetical protein
MSFSGFGLPATTTQPMFPSFAQPQTQSPWGGMSSVAPQPQPQSQFQTNFNDQLHANNIK